MITAGGIFVNSHNYYSSEQSEDKDSSPTSEMNEKAELIERTGQSVSENSKHLIHCLTIIGQIEGHYAAPPSNKTTKYEHIMPALVAIEQDRSIEGLLIILNTVGGDVEAGLAIAELISGTGIFVLMNGTKDCYYLFLRWKRYWSAHRCSVLLYSFNNFLCRCIY